MGLDGDRFSDGPEDIQIDPATLPENRGLLAAVDAQLSAAMEARQHRQLLAQLLAEAVPPALYDMEKRIEDAGRTHPKEEDLRSGVADALRLDGQLVVTEPRLGLEDWSRNLGGFDLGLLIDDGLVVGETKWANGSVFESMWDVFKLASALRVPRVHAAVAIYAASPKSWAQSGPAELFANHDHVIPTLLMQAWPTEWQKNLDGSTVQPFAVSTEISLRLLRTATETIFGRDWEIRALQVINEHPTEHLLENGWPEGGRPEQPRKLTWW
jgi:hypothetical protein